MAAVRTMAQAIKTRIIQSPSFWSLAQSYTGDSRRCLLPIGHRGKIVSPPPPPRRRGPPWSLQARPGPMRGVGFGFQRTASKGVFRVRGRAFLAIGAIAVLAGCSPTQEDKARFAAADDAQCQSYGTTPGTPAYTDCRLKLDRQRAILASKPLPPPTFESCPTAASGLACVSPTAGR